MKQRHQRQSKRPMEVQQAVAVERNHRLNVSERENSTHVVNVRTVPTKKCH